jgi:hypothetical protein
VIVYEYWDGADRGGGRWIFVREERMHRGEYSRLWPAVVGSGLLAVTAAWAQGGGIERFYGTYTGEAISEGGTELDKRDINAEITPQGKGFKVKFTVVIKRGKDQPKRDEYTIAFSPTKRPGIYSSAMRADVFGNAVPLDPLAGDPYMWARLEGDKFWRYALFVTDSGGYEMQTYEYTLAPGGMDLRYSRIRDGEVLRTVTGKLKKVR